MFKAYLMVGHLIPSPGGVNAITIIIIFNMIGDIFIPLMPIYSGYLITFALIPTPGLVPTQEYNHKFLIITCIVRHMINERLRLYGALWSMETNSKPELWTSNCRREFRIRNLLIEILGFSSCWLLFVVSFSYSTKHVVAEWTWVSTFQQSHNFLWNLKIFKTPWPHSGCIWRLDYAQQKLCIV